MIVLLVVLSVLTSVTLITLIVGLALYFKRLDTATKEMTETLKAIRENVVPLADDTRRVLINLDTVVTSTRNEVERVGRVVSVVESLFEGKTIVDTASKAVSSSRATFVSALEGLKQGLKALRSAKKESKEESSDE